jgi:hypothetical protein
MDFAGPALCLVGHGFSRDKTKTSDESTPLAPPHPRKSLVRTFASSADSQISPQSSCFASIVLVPFAFRTAGIPPAALTSILRAQSNHILN